MDQLTNRQNICWAGKILAVIFNHYFYLRFILTEFEMQDPTLNRTDNHNGSIYREPFYFDIFYLMYILNLRYMLNLIWTLTLTFVSEKKVLPLDLFLVMFLQMCFPSQRRRQTPWFDSLDGKIGGQLGKKDGLPMLTLIIYLSEFLPQHD